MLVVPALDQTREHLFKDCPEWEAQQKILWAKVKKETGRWKDRWKIRDLLAEERCSRAVLDFLSSTGVGRHVPAEDDVVSEESEAELREWEEGQEAVEPGAGRESSPLLLPTPDFMSSFLCLFPLSLSLLFPWRVSHLSGTGQGGGQRGACNMPSPRGQRTGNGLYIIPP